MSVCLYAQTLSNSVRISVMIKFVSYSTLTFDLEAETKIDGRELTELAVCSFKIQFNYIMFHVNVGLIVDIQGVW